MATTGLAFSSFSHEIITYQHIDTEHASDPKGTETDTTCIYTHIPRAFTHAHHT